MALQFIQQHKEGRVAGLAVFNTGGIEFSTWTFEGQPSHGATPPAAPSFANPTNTTQGSVGQASPPAGTQQWLHACISQGGHSSYGGRRAILYDRLMHVSGLSGTVATAQNLNSGSPATLTRWSPSYAGLYTSPDAITGDGNEIFLEVTTAIGATPATATATYTNSAGLAGQVTQAVTVNHAATQITRLPLAVGDTGVQSVTSVTLSGSTGTAGNISVVVAHRHLEIFDGGVCPEIVAPTLSDGGAIEILPGACLAWLMVSTATPNGNAQALIDAWMTFVDA